MSYRPDGPRSAALNGRTLQAPAREGLAYLGKSGWVGVRCSCGFIVTARSMGSLEAALSEHQDPKFCPKYAEYQESTADT